MGSFSFPLFPICCWAFIDLSWQLLLVVTDQSCSCKFKSGALLVTKSEECTKSVSLTLNLRQEYRSTWIKIMWDFTRFLFGTNRYGSLLDSQFKFLTAESFLRFLVSTKWVVWNSFCLLSLDHINQIQRRTKLMEVLWIICSRDVNFARCFVEQKLPIMHNISGLLVSRRLLICKCMSNLCYFPGLPFDYDQLTEHAFASSYPI